MEQPSGVIPEIICDRQKSTFSMVVSPLSMPLDDDGEYFTPDRSSAFVKMDTHPSETDGRTGGKGKYGMDASSTRALRVVVCGCTLSGRSSFMARKVGGESGRVALRKIVSPGE